MDPQIIVYAIVLGVVYGLYGVLTKRKPGEPVSPKKLARTAFVWGAAGAIVAVTDTPLTEAGIASQVSQVTVLGVVFDMAWNKAVGDRLADSGGGPAEG